MENPYKVGDRVILLINILNEYGGSVFNLGTEVEIESLWESKGMFKYGIIIKQSKYPVKYGTNIENIRPTLQTSRDNILNNILDGPY